MSKSSLLIILLFATIAFSGCTESPEEVIQTADEIISTAQEVADAMEEQPDVPESNTDVVLNSTDQIRVGAFNIQVFGVSKASKPEVMDTLAQIIRTYDVIAIQEIRDASQESLPQLVDLVNSDGSQYEYIVSERLGRTSSKEQYAYVYDSTTVELIGSPEVYPEPEGTDPFHRQPYITQFEAIAGNYDAVLMVIHTDPDEATEEINALDDVMDYAMQVYPDEQDFILLGDFNADGSYFDEDGTSDLDEYHWVINDSWDTTTRSTDYTYDRIVLTDSSDLGADYGVYRYDIAYNLTEDETIAVSDHYPIYADFIIDQDNASN